MGGSYLRLFSMLIKTAGQIPGCVDLGGGHIKTEFLVEEGTESSLLMTETCEKLLHQVSSSPCLILAGVEERADIGDPPPRKGEGRVRRLWRQHPGRGGFRNPTEFACLGQWHDHRESYDGCMLKPGRRVSVWPAGLGIAKVSRGPEYRIIIRVS